MRIALLILGILTLLTGPYMFFAPNVFYDNTPGVSMMGPFNLHFIRDVGLAFLVSGGAVIFGALQRNRALAIAGAMWPFLHGLFHLQIWAARNFALDQVAAFDFAAVIIPASAMMVLAWRFKTHQAGR